MLSLRAGMASIPAWWFNNLYAKNLTALGSKINLQAPCSLEIAQTMSQMFLSCVRLAVMCGCTGGINRTEELSRICRGLFLHDPLTWLFAGPG